MLSLQFMKEIVSITIREENGRPVLEYRVDHPALQRLNDHRLGRTLLVSDHLDWPAADIITTAAAASAMRPQPA
jgi:hypothetical protein